MNNTLTKQNFAKFFGQAMGYKDFWNVQSEWELRFKQDYEEYCKNHNKPKKSQKDKEEIKDRPGLCWEESRYIHNRDLVGWIKRKPGNSKS